jgi:preprotein translocase subunit SecG
MWDNFIARFRWIVVTLLFHVLCFVLCFMVLPINDCVEIYKED